jgi:hypothetical protein
MSVIFIFPFFIFNRFNYDKLLLFFNNLDYFKTNNIKFKPYYMFPHNSLNKGKDRDFSNTINITSNNNQVINANDTTNVTIGNSGNIVNVSNSEIDNINPKASTSKLVNNSDVNSIKSDNNNNKSDNKPNKNITNNYFMFKNLKNELIIPEFKKSKSLSNLNFKYNEKIDDDIFKDLFTTEETLKRDEKLRKAKSVNNFYDFNKSSNLLNTPNSKTVKSIYKSHSLNKSNSDILLDDNLPDDDNLPSIIVTDFDKKKSKTILNSSLLNNKLLNNLTNTIINSELNNKPIINNELDNNKSIINNEFDIKINNKTGTGINCTINPINNYVENEIKNTIKNVEQKHIELLKIKTKKSKILNKKILSIFK